MEKCDDTKWASMQLTEKEAVDFAKSEIWKVWNDEQVVRFQLFQKRLAMPFPRLHKAMTVVLKREVWTHEFAFREQLVQEYLGTRPAPTIDEIIDLIPEGKRRILIMHGIK